MSKSKPNQKTEVGKQLGMDASKAIHTSMQPYHFGMDFVSSLQSYNRKNIDFVTKRMGENFKYAAALLSANDTSEIFKESSNWWQTMGKDYLAHVADGLDLSKEVRTEIGDLVETEVAISNAKPQEMFDNSPV